MPVLVFIHGGAFTQGSAAKPTYDGTRFAKDGVIQVNIAYRLNGLGFLPAEELEEEYGYIGNTGVLDQIAGLEWVKENIGYFGGDPDNITVSGESAGSFSVSNLILSPLAEGLFDKAIMESGNLLGQPLAAPLSNGKTSQALENAERLMESLGAETFVDMLDADADDIASESNFEMNIIHPSDQAFFPVFDGVIIPENPYSALQNGDYNGVDILAGYNTDEGTLFVDEGISEQDYISLVENIFGGNAPAVLERYPVDEEHTATDRARFMMKMGLRMGSDVLRTSSAPTATTRTCTILITAYPPLTRRASVRCTRWNYISYSTPSPPRYCSAMRTGRLLTKCITGGSIL
jgi:para-nitrobenzyl esterase